MARGKEGWRWVGLGRAEGKEVELKGVARGKEVGVWRRVWLD